jgi:hypothetical protein
LRFNQCGRCAVARCVAVRTVALRWWVDAVQLGGFDPPLPKLVLCARQTAGLDTAQYGALVDAACRCGLAQTVAMVVPLGASWCRGNGAVFWLRTY